MSRILSTTALAGMIILALAGLARGQVAPGRPASVAPQSEPGLQQGAELPVEDEDSGVEPPRGSSLGRVPWTLVVEAVRTAKGELIPWHGEGDWARMWRVPGEAGGTRYIPVEGDAEDREQVKSSEPYSRDSLSHGLSFLASKYRAPAIAVVVREPSSVAVVGWRNGNFSAWARSALAAGTTAEDARLEALKLIARTFPAGEKKEVNAARALAKVLAFREVSGGLQYQVVVRGRIDERKLVRLVERAGGLSVAEIVTTSEGFELIVNASPGMSEPVERRLSRAGLPTEPAGRPARDARLAEPQD